MSDERRKTSEPGDNGIEFNLTRRVHFSETDRAGVLYFAHYYRFMEETEHAFWRQLGLPVITEVDGCETSWPRVVTSCEYFAPVQFDDQLELVLKIAHLGNKSIKYEVEFRCNGRRTALGKMTAVYCKIVDGKFQSLAIPASIRHKLEEAGHHQ